MTMLVCMYDCGRRGVLEGVDGIRLILPLSPLYSARELR